MDGKEEVRKGWTISSNMKKVWKVQLDLTRKLLEVCDRHGLRVTACGGTALGAVREHGYIPWDDDIDLQMLREDYDRLVSIAPDEFKSPYFFQCSATDKNYMHGHAQLRMDGTAAILYDDIFQDFHQGIFIDIFPLDAVPESEADIQRLREQSEKIYNRVKEVSYASVHLLNHNPSRLLKGITFLISKMFLNVEKENNKYENLFRAVDINSAKDVAMMTFTWDLFEKTRCTKNVMENIIKVPFEDIMMPVPAIYDELLRRQYGEYMTPVQSPSYHGVFIALDAERSYKDYLREEREMRKKIHRDGLLRALRLKR